MNVADCLIDLSVSDSTSTSSVAEADTAEIQTATVELDCKQIALYRGNREYQTITVEHYSIGIHKLPCSMSLISIWIVIAGCSHLVCLPKFLNTVGWATCWPLG